MYYSTVQGRMMLCHIHTSLICIVRLWAYVQGSPKPMHISGANCSSLVAGGRAVTRDKTTCVGVQCLKSYATCQPDTTTNRKYTK